MTPLPDVLRPALEPHWRARLADVQDLLLVAHDTDDVVRALLQLTNLLTDEWAARDQPILLALVRDASRLLNDQQSLGWGSDVRDWNRAAAPFVGTEAPR